MDFTKFIILAMLGESIWETIKMVYDKNKFNFDRLGAMIVGLLIALGTGLDLFKLVGIPITIPYLGSIFTGLLISRGANVVHDILNSITNIQQDLSKTNTVNK